MAKRNMYSMHHQNATMGLLWGLTPTMACEVAPNDTWSGTQGLLVRMSPLVRPLLMDLYVENMVFYVPHRLVMDDWEDFIAQGPNADNPISLPTQNSPNANLWQVDGEEFAGDPTTPVNWNALRNRALNLIYNEYFRDQDEVDPYPADFIPRIEVDGPNSAVINTHTVSPKRHYWNELRSQLQTGASATAPIDVAGETVKAEDILKAIAEQKLQMRRATYGTRYVDILKSYGVRVNYQMLQRPELIGVSRGVINVTDIVATDGGSNLGTTAGYGVSGTRLKLRRKSFPEHGSIIAVTVIRPPFTDHCIQDWMDFQRGYDSFYDPGLELLPEFQVAAGNILGPRPDNAGETIGHMPWGQWYRRQTNRTHHGLRDWVIEQIGNPAEAWDNTAMDLAYLIKPTAGYWDASKIFKDTEFGHFQISAVNNFRAARMISRGNRAAVSGST